MPSRHDDDDLTAFQGILQAILLGLNIWLWGLLLWLWMP